MIIARNEHGACCCRLSMLLLLLLLWKAVVVAAADDDDDDDAVDGRHTTLKPLLAAVECGNNLQVRGAT